MFDRMNDRRVAEDRVEAPTRPKDSLVQRFEATVARFAGNCALTCGDEHLSFPELNRRADKAARQLLELHLQPGSIVAIWLDRSPAMIVAMLGVLKAGHTYLPLDATYPVARIQQTLEDAQPAAIFASPDLAAGLPSSGTPVLFLDRPSPIAQTSEPLLVGEADPATAAYVIYTSGSTGKPKGVRVSHENVLRLFDQTQPHFRFDHNDVWTMFHSFAFDFSVWEIWGPLLTGGRLVIVPFESTRAPEEFYRLLSQQRVTVLNQTPSAFLLLNQVEERGLSLPLALRLIIFGGEALQFSTLNSWFLRHPDTRPQLVNCYGITETTVHVTVRNVTQADAMLEQESLLGAPIPDLEIHLLDASLKPVAQGAIGEICVGGPGVSLGYLNRPELNAERFIQWHGQRLYRSGDLARWRPDGELVYLGRRDEQVKISGFRIELGEVEAAIAAQPGIRQVCVVPRTVGDRTELAAYCTEESHGTASVPSLAQAMKRQLPAQMLPATYTLLPSMPLTANGKVDRKALPVLALPTHPAAAAAQPASEIEEAVLALVREVVGVPEIGLGDFFFSVGGHSLLGTQFVLKARQAFGVKLTLRDLFETESIADIAARIEELILDDLANMTDDEAARLADRQETAV